MRLHTHRVTMLSSSSTYWSTGSRMYCSREPGVRVGWGCSRAALLSSVTPRSSVSLAAASATAVSTRARLRTVLVHLMVVGVLAVPDLRGALAMIVLIVCAVVLRHPFFL